MPSPGRVVIAFAKGDSDQRAASSLSIGFTREGIEVAQTTQANDVIHLLGREQGAPDLVIASIHLEGPDDGLALVRAVRAKHSPGVDVDRARPPVILIGDAEKRGAALEAGASLFVPKPAYVKDIVTLAGILSMAREGLEAGWGGELGALHLYYVVRALSAARKTGVLTLTRSHRRGELRFYDGEVTSAQVGMLHGQAAFHQLLLWPEAHFDLRAEQVVRRQQIPLTPAELLQDAERFLRDFNELAQSISPSSLYEQDLRKVAEHIDDIPREVVPVLRLFDGLRSVADVIEDSSVRMAEALQIVRKLIALGVIHKLGTPRAHADAAAVLQVEDWLVGQTEPGKPRRKSQETAATAGPAGDWGALGVAASASYAPVVPAKSTTGEIKVPDLGGASLGETVAAASPKRPSSEEPIVKANGKSAAKPAAPELGKARPRTAQAVTVPVTADDPALAETPHAGVQAAETAASLAETAPVPRTAESAPARRPVIARTRAASGEINAQEAPSTPEPQPQLSAIEISNDLPSEVLAPVLRQTQPVKPLAPRASSPRPHAAPPPIPAEIHAAGKPHKPERKSGPKSAVAHAPGLDRFHDHEEAFFSEEEHFAKAEEHPHESFADLDEGHAPRPSFWRRIFQRRRKPQHDAPATAAARKLPTK